MLLSQKSSVYKNKTWYLVLEVVKHQNNKPVVGVHQPVPNTYNGKYYNNCNTLHKNHCILSRSPT